jgi:hypothetical protein
MHVLVEWEGENKCSIININAIVHPRKDSYHTDEMVKAKFQGKTGGKHMMQEL